MRGSGSAPQRAARRSDHRPAQNTARPPATASPPADRRRIVRPVVLTSATSQASRSSPPAPRTSSASRAQTAPKSTMPVLGTCSAATPVACGSIARSPAASSRRTPGTPLECARRPSSSSAGSSCSPVAMMSLPIRWASMPWRSQ
jgi:hypothetical protein